MRQATRGRHPALLSPQELADHLKVSVATIYQWRYRSEGPPGFKLSGRVRYRWAELQAWLEDNADSWAG